MKKINKNCNTKEPKVLFIACIYHEQESLLIFFFFYITETFKLFLTEFMELDGNKQKNYKYVQQMTKLAQREQVAMYIELDDIESYNSELCERVLKNTKRYISILYETVQELLPSYKMHDVPAKDSLGIKCKIDFTINLIF